MVMHTNLGTLSASIGAARVMLDAAAVGSWLGTLEAQPGTSVPRVVDQNPKPGQYVPEGTVVDIIMTPTKDVPMVILANGHKAFADMMVVDVTEHTAVSNNPALSAILDGTDDPSTLTQAQITVVTDALTALGATVDDTDSETSFEAGYSSLKQANEFTK